MIVLPANMTILSDAVGKVAATGQDVRGATQTCQNECARMRDEVTAFTRRARE